jgi:hypothetical protein
MTKQLLLVGWDAADWKTIDRLADQGDMSIMKGLIERGTRGNPRTPHPVPPPMLWTCSALAPWACEPTGAGARRG